MAELYDIMSYEDARRVGIACKSVKERMTAIIPSFVLSEWVSADDFGESKKWVLNVTCICRDPQGNRLGRIIKFIVDGLFDCEVSFEDQLWNMLDGFRETGSRMERDAFFLDHLSRN